METAFQSLRMCNPVGGAPFTGLDAHDAFTARKPISTPGPRESGRGEAPQAGLRGAAGSGVCCALCSLP